MGRQRLHGHLRRLPAARRSRRGPARAPARVRVRADAVRACLAGRRTRRLQGPADRGPCGPGPRRRDRRPGVAFDPHDHVRGGPGSQPRGRHLGRDGRRRRRCRRASRRHPHRRLGLALDLVHQRPDRADRGRHGPALHRRGRGQAQRTELRPRRRDHGHARAIAAGARDRPHGRHRLGLDPDACPDRRRRRAAGGVRRDRGPVREGPVDAASHLRVAHAARVEHRRVHARRRDVRDVVLPLAVPPAGARVLAVNAPGSRSCR